MKTTLSRVEPLAGFTSLPGCHCVTASFRKICAFNGYAVSEEMLFGLGAGAGFVYWHQKGQVPMLGGRGNNKGFHQDLSRRTGIAIEEHRTSSAKTAEQELVRLLEAGQPVTINADMPYLTYLGLPEEAHFGGHVVVVCGYDSASRQVLISDMAPRQTGCKDAVLAPLSMDQLAKARGSKFKPFPPGNCWFTFDFSAAHPPDKKAVREAIAQCAEDMINPPIQNLGAAGIRTAAARVTQWPVVLDQAQLRMALFNIFIFSEIGGSGGGMFRFMYSRFLEEAAGLTGNARYAEAGKKMDACAKAWRELAAPLQDALETADPVALVPAVVKGLEVLHGKESSVWKEIAAL
jgi:hypothetical protein